MIKYYIRGSWFNDSGVFRIVNHTYVESSNGYYTVGFRLIKKLKK